MWPGFSRTQGAAGLDLAIVSGYGHPKLTDIKKLRPYISEEKMRAVGNREFDIHNVEAIISSEMNYYSQAGP
jgi:arginase